MQTHLLRGHEHNFLSLLEDTILRSSLTATLNHLSTLPSVKFPEPSRMACASQLAGMHRGWLVQPHFYLRLYRQSVAPRTKKAGFPEK